MLNIKTENETKCHNLRPRSQRKDGDISQIFAFAFHHSIYHDEASS